MNGFCLSNWSWSVKIKLLCKDLGVFFIANLLMGCASQVTQRDAVAQEAHRLEAELQENPSSSVLKVPHLVSPQQEYMYKMLVAETARLRGDEVLAAKYFFEIATQTREPQLAKYATQTAVSAEQYDIATPAARLWVSLTPNDPNPHLYLGRILLHQQRIEEAVVHFEIMLDSLKDNPEQRQLVLEAILKQQKNQTQVLKLMEKLASRRQNDPVILLIYSRQLLHANNPEKALEILRMLLARFPDYTEAVPLYAYLLDTQNQTELALQKLKQALSEYPDNAEWRLMYARMLADAKQFEEAIKQFQLLLSQYPQNGEILYVLGILSLETNQLSVAKGYFLELVHLGERLNTACYYLGQIAQHEKDLNQALSWYRQVKGDSNYLSAQAQIAFILRDQRQFDKAIRHLRNVPTNNTEDALSLIQLEAELLKEQKRYQQAMEAYNRALKLNSNSVDLLYMRALLAEEMGLIEQAEQDLRVLLEKEPKNANVLNALGYSLADNTVRYEEAYELIQNALDLSPGKYYILDSMGWVLYKMGNYTQAIAYLRKAQAKQADPEIAAHLGEVLWVSGDRRAATEVWEQALKDFPEDEKLREVVHLFLPELLHKISKE